MVLKKLFIKAYRSLTFKGILNFEESDPDVSIWYEFINSIPEPQNDIERSYAKYLCRMHYFSMFYSVMANLASIFALLFSIPILSRKPSSLNKNLKHITNNGLLIVKASNVGYEDIIPQGVLEKYGDAYEVWKPEMKAWYLVEDAKVLFKQCLKKYPLRFHFNYIIFRELCMYSVLLNNYKPKVIAVYVNERNIAGPILSYMCENKEVDFISFMHGEYLLQLIQGFMRFTKFYVWDEHYIKMFQEDLRCAPNQFVIYTPNKLKGICIPRKEPESYEYFATYYFGAESIKRIKKVAEAFSILRKQGKKCKIRPHPRRSNMKVIYEVFDGFTIEDTSVVSLADSMECSEYTIALNSTVLSEAYYSSKEIVIDDYSEPERYHNLKKRKYIMIYKPHKLFSELLKGD